MKNAVTMIEIAAALGVEKRTAERRATKENWPFEEQAGRGGKKRLYTLESLPAAIRDTLNKIALFSVPAVIAPAATPTKAVTVKRETVRMSVVRDTADAKQIIVRDARLGIVNALDRAVKSQRITMSKAINTWLAGIKEGSMQPAQMLWCALANDKNGYEWDLDWTSGHASAVPRAGQSLAAFAGRLSRNTLYRWIDMRASGGQDALIPRKIMKDMRVPAWAPYFLAEMQRPQKPALSSAWEQMEKTLVSMGWHAHVGNSRCGDNEYPSVDAVGRWYHEKYGKLARQQGRNTGSAINPYKFTHSRTNDGMWPLLEVHSDGWNTKFTAPHPVSGKFVTLEAWHSHDVATRKAYVHERSIGLSESMIVIMGSLYAVACEDGEPVVWQTDNTGSVKNDRVEFDPVTSIAARRGMTIVHNLPGNSQANGIAENFNKYLEERAKELATFQGKGMDSLAHKRVFKITQNMVKAQNAGDNAEVKRLRAEAERTGCGLVFTSYAEAVIWIKRVVAEFNDMPHREHPKINDPISGKKRHMTPNEVMAQFVAEGWKPEPLSGLDLEDAFYVHERKMVQRGKVSIMGQEYHHADMDELNGEQVMVAYDIQDGSRVWIKDLDGVLICEASFYAARGFRERNFYDIALDKRVDMQQKRLSKKFDDVEAQRPGNVVEHERNLIEHEAVFEIPVLNVDAIEVAANIVELPKAKPVRPMFETDASKYRWITRNQDQATYEDSAWLDWYRTTSEYEDLFGDLEMAAR